MSISDELMLAILSMDSYNRGYAAGIEDPLAQGGGLGVSQENGPTYQIGTATILEDADDPGGVARAAGFYAIAYEWNGETVISYRGTDNPMSWANLNPWSDAPGSDIWNGYGVGAGHSTGAQAHLAAEFFQAVTETSDGDPRTGDAILTGHSLGGGLAVNDNSPALKRSAA